MFTGLLPHVVEVYRRPLDDHTNEVVTDRFGQAIGVNPRQDEDAQTLVGTWP